MSETAGGKHRQRSYVSALQVAERAGVSRSAVSRTFTEGASVSAATRKRVIEAAEALGYHVNHLARGLIQDRSNIVSLVATDLNTPYQAGLIHALTSRLQRAGKVAMVINTSGQTQSVEKALRQTLEYRADATVVLSGQPPGSLIQTCLTNGQHVIMLNRDDAVPGPDRLMVTNRAAAREAFLHLQAAGCRQIALVASEVGTASVVAREEAFVAAAAEAGTTVQVAHFGPTTYASGRALGRQMLARPQRPDGVFCVTDLLACGFMDAARSEFGLSIPDDLCVIGFDDIEQAGWSSFDLTTFRQPIDQIAARIISLLDEPPPPGTQREPIAFPAELIWRRSVRGTRR
ncbi:LacI family DNA-binding transcriptional regulator [Pseudotabrizicola algicola]|uniref:Substrate-binding domain-containing protein n=1 Tax=Pseudotabrizicola algicola TaxID=2709381 RepID=A0A6B3RMI5_9RHOB|nr:substrate-binding domain-containing protein [Pseudotabrizicola algicola]NEX47294.1 substrate-binding domain-containing protein [Pseudotabrizicola algicola]